MNASAKRLVRIGDDTVAIDDSGFSVEPLGSGEYLVSDGTKRWRVVVAGASADCWVFVDGRVARVEILGRDDKRARPRTSAHDMSSPMPATVVKVLAPAGTSVQKGAPLLVLEAMKMELAIRAARSGVVRAVLCGPGDLVQPGVPLVELDS